MIMHENIPDFYETYEDRRQRIECTYRRRMKYLAGGCASLMGTGGALMLLGASSLEESLHMDSLFSGLGALSIMTASIGFLGGYVVFSDLRCKELSALEKETRPSHYNFRKRPFPTHRNP